MGGSDDFALAQAALTDRDCEALRELSYPGADLPPLAIRHCFMAVCVLFDVHVNWRDACHHLLLRPDFVRRLIQYVMQPLCD